MIETFIAADKKLRRLFQMQNIIPTQTDEEINKVLSFFVQYFVYVHFFS